MEDSASNESLYHAVADNNSTLLNELLDRGGDVDAFFEDTMNISSKSLLHICCGKGLIDCLHVLIQHGAQLDVRDKWGQTPLMYSVSIQFPEIAMVLLDAKSDLVNCQDRYGKSPLHCAVDVGSVELVQILLDRGADVNVRNHEGFSPLMICCSHVTEEHQLVLKELLSYNALVELQDYKGKRTAMHIAVCSKNINAVEILIAAGSNINDIDKTLRNPLTHAIFMSRNTNDLILENIISLLVSAGADLNVTVTETGNALLACSQIKSEKLMKFFLTSGADPNVKFPSGLSPALVSASANDYQCLQLLIQYNCDLISQGSVYKRRRKEEFHLDPFQMALMEQHLDLCILMILSGYPLNKRWFMPECQTCLSVAFPEFNSSPVHGRDLTLPGQNAGQEDKLAWILAMTHECCSLKNLCMYAVRSFVKGNLLNGVSELPLPQAVKDAVLLKHVLDGNEN